MWYKQKTTWTGIAAVVSAVGGFFTGTMDLNTSIQIGLTGLIGIFLRQGIAKVGNGG
jgi:hypothetical protein